MSKEKITRFFKDLLFIVAFIPACAKAPLHEEISFRSVASAGKCEKPGQELTTKYRRVASKETKAIISSLFQDDPSWHGR